MKAGAFYTQRPSSDPNQAKILFYKRRGNRPIVSRTSVATNAHAYAFL